MLYYVYIHKDTYMYNMIYIYISIRMPGAYAYHSAYFTLMSTIYVQIL